MKTRFYNARVLSMSRDYSVEAGEVWTEDERIIYVGPSAEKGTGPVRWDREIDCGGDLLMPGFKNAHTHSTMTFLRSHADDLPLQEWLARQVFPYEARLRPEDNYDLTRLAVLEYISGGITAIMDMYLVPEVVAAACRDTGMRCVQVGGVSNYNYSPAAMEKYYNELNNSDPLNSFRLGFHAEYTTSAELIGAVAKLAEKYHAPVYTHLAETEAEVQECRGRYGMSPVEYLASRGIFAYGGGGYHMVHVTENDRRIMKENGIAVITSPASNTKLASGIAPLTDYVRDGITVAIGTDGPASNNCLDMFREMFLATGLQKLLMKDASALPAREVLRMATAGGAEVMGLNKCRCLAPGMLADMIMIDLQQPNMQPIHSIPENLVYSGSKSDIRMTMVHGKILYDRLDGREHYHVGEDPSVIYEKVRRICERVFA